jgi:hypothetical protein
VDEGGAHRGEQRRRVQCAGDGDATEDALTRGGAQPPVAARRGGAG